MLTILVAGASLRLVGVGSMNLWVDEAVIANIAARGEMAEFLSYPGTNRPFGFLYLQHGLLSIHHSEWTALQLPVDTVAWTGKPAYYRTQREEIVGAMAVLRSRSPQGVPDETHIAVNILAIPALNYYSTFHATDQKRFGGLFFGRRSFLPESGDQDRTYQAMSATVRRHGRVYFLLSHFSAEDVAALSQLAADEQAKELERFEFPGVILTLVEQADPEQPYR